MSAEKKIAVEISEAAMKVLLQESLHNLDNGARGIGNIVESMLINPLSRYLFDSNVQENATLKILNIDADSMPAEIKCEANI